MPQANSLNSTGVRSEKEQIKLLKSYHVITFDKIKSNRCLSSKIFVKPRLHHYLVCHFFTMLLYEDILTGDEMFSDAFPLYVSTPSNHSHAVLFNYPRKEVDGIVYEVNCQMIIVKEGDVDIGGIPPNSLACPITKNSSLLGANPSAEEQEEALADGAAQVNNVVHSFRLQQTTFDKKSYLTYLKASRSTPKNT